MFSLKHPSALCGKRVVVFGLGTKGGGTEVVKWLLKHGANVCATDTKTEHELALALEALRGLPVRYALGGHQREDIESADLVVRNPAVPIESSFLAYAAQRGVPVVMDVTLFFLFCPVPIAGITGTRGKSTTTAVAGEILRRSTTSTVVAGNIGVSPLKDLDRITPGAPVVLELSSWQLEGLEPFHMSPRWSVLTTILPDHLNRYPSMEAYIKAKETIVKYQRSGDKALLPVDDPSGERFAALTKASVRWFGVLDNPDNDRAGVFRLGEDVVLRRGDGTEVLLPWRELGGTGDHTKRNMLAGALLAIEMGSPLSDVRAVLRSFQGLPDRLEMIHTLEGRTFVNDTTATTPEAVIAALRSFADRMVVLITGGTDKRLEYASLASEIRSARNLRAVFFLAGSATDKLRHNLGSDRKERSEVRSMTDAVQFAWDASQSGDVILLSPGAASFELFRDEFDRGQQFRDAAERVH